MITQQIRPPADSIARQPHHEQVEDYFVQNKTSFIDKLHQIRPEFAESLAKMSILRNRVWALPRVCRGMLLNTHCLCLPKGVDHGAPALSHHLIVPEPCFWVDGFTDCTQNPQARQIVPIRIRDWSCQPLLFNVVHYLISTFYKYACMLGLRNNSNILPDKHQREAYWKDTLSKGVKEGCVILLLSNRWHLWANYISLCVWLRNHVQYC